MKHINGGLETKGGCFIEKVKIGAGLLHFMKMIFEPQTDMLSQQEGVLDPIGGTRDVAEASLQRRHSKGLRSENIFLDHERKGLSQL